MKKSDYELVSALGNPADWDTYHRIRREELFEERGRIGMYDPYRIGEKIPNNFPLLLKFQNRGIGTARLDVRDDGTAVIRLVAVTKGEQGKGHGLHLAKWVEDFARTKDVHKILANAAPEALGYYEKLGYTRDEWDSSELTGISANSIQMSKVLS
ncbi:MAG TPA: GNAT family N-acetyltransferase [Candidatus Paceibacterota bacterium]|nr:GNAT family N-acetyltransferase [Candidatus Paceibacterota bacterium]